MRKRFRKSRERRDEALAGHAARLAGKLMGRLRLHERTESANRLAVLHPGRTLGLTVGLLLLSLVIGTTVSVNQLLRSGVVPRQQDLSMGDIASVRPMFDGFRRIQSTKSYHDSQVTGMISDGQRLRHDLDSLVALPRKTHDDSAAIIVKYHQLEFIVKSIKQENHETE